MMSTNKMPMLCKFGGDFIWESNKVYYKGGTNRIVHVNRGIDYINLVSKVHGICKFTDISNIKYKYPGLDLDSLVSIENDDDVSNMMEAFPQSSEPIQLFVFCGQNLSIPTANPSFLMQNADNENDQASLQNFHQSNGTPAPFSHNTNVNNNNVPSASNDLRKVDCLLMDNQELHYGVVGSCVNDMPKIMSVLKEGQEFEDANAFHKALREYAISSNFEYKRTRSGGGRYQAKCIKDNCSWGIHAWKLPDKPTFKIKSLKGDHTCNVVNESTISNTRTHRQASRKWIADLEGGPVDTMTELKRQLGSVDHSGTICSSMKRHRTQGPISTRERKDKVGERISALQELVSPFGKTDTASVLLEAMEYIKFLHDQVRVCCSAPYLQNTPQPMQQESEYYNLRSRGLCLVPVTVGVARSNGADMWAPTMTTTNQ